MNILTVLPDDQSKLFLISLCVWANISTKLNQQNTISFSLPNKSYTEFPSDIAIVLVVVIIVGFCVTTNDNNDVKISGRKLAAALDEKT